MIVTTSTLPPQIVQNFSRSLLDPYPYKSVKQFREELDAKVLKRYKLDSRRYREYEKLLEICGAFYEWKEAEKAYNRSKEKIETQRPNLPIDLLSQCKGKLRNVYVSFIHERNDSISR